MLTRERMFLVYFFGVGGLLLIDWALFLYLQDSYHYQYMAVYIVFFGVLALIAGAACILRRGHPPAGSVEDRT